MPPSVNKSNADHYSASKAVTDYHEFPGRSHFTLGQPGWEEVADYALQWAVDHARLGAGQDAHATPAEAHASLAA
jgi:hypothetical protein